MKELLSLFLPDSFLNHFEIDNIKELGEVSHKRMTYHIELTEKNQLPPAYNSSDYESKGFYNAKTIQDFPIRGKAVYLVVKRRRWRNKVTGKDIKSDYSFISEGSKLTQDLSDFLKDTGRDQRRHH